MVKLGGKNHPHSQSICLVPSPEWNPCVQQPFAQQSFAHIAGT